MPAGWEVFTDFSLPMGTDGRIPDLAVVRVDVEATRSNRNPYAPSAFGLVGEVVSPRTRKIDRFAKPGEYAEAGIPIYWRIELDPGPRLHAYLLREGSYVEVDGLPPLPWGVLDVSLGDLGIR
jgi:Uma2 family endonuclease